MLWRVSPARDLLATVRLVRGELITAQVEVARVPAGALTSVNGEEGVYVWQRGKTVFALWKWCMPAARKPECRASKMDR